jgi:hypothetical protein
MKQTYYVQDTDDTVPTSKSASGTVSTSGKVATGTGTNFLLLEAGDYLVTITGKQFREIERVISATQLILKAPFTSNLASVNFNYLKKHSCTLTNISIAAGEGTDTAINGVVLKDGNSVNYQVSEFDKATGRSFLEPVFVEGASAGDATIAYQSF